MIQDPCLLFTIDGFTCALPVEEVVHVSGVVALEPLPGLPPTLLGTCKYHGEIVFGIDVSRAFGLAFHPYSSRARMLITRREGFLFGVLADSLGELLTPSYAGGGPPAAEAVGAHDALRVRDLFYAGTTPVYVIDPWLLVGDDDRVTLATLTSFIRTPFPGGTP